MLIYDHKPQASRHDPYVFPKRAGIDYVAATEAAIERCLYLMTKCGRLEHQLAEVEGRLLAGDEWFRRREYTHPRYMNGHRTLCKHLNTRTLVRAQLDATSFALWIECCQLYAATRYIEPRLATYLLAPIGTAVPDHPRTVWDVLTGGREPPGHWPLEDRDYWIEGGSTWLSTQP